MGNAPYCGVPRKPISPLYRESLVRLGENIRRERRRKGYTQEAFAEIVDLHSRVIQKIESGKTNILVTTALRIQVALDCPWTDLVPKMEIKKVPVGKHR